MLAVAPPGSAVELPQAAWYPVRWQGQAGWMWGEFLAFDAQAPAHPGQAARAQAALALVRRLLTWVEGGEQGALLALEEEVRRLLEQTYSPSK